MQTFYKLALITLFLAFIVKAKAQSLGDPVVNEDFGHGTAYSPVGPALSGTLTDMPSGSATARCPADGAYLILNTSSNCFGDTFKTINFDHSDTNPYGYLMMVNGNNKPVAYYHRQISGSSFCAGAKYKFAAFITNIYIGMPRPDGYVNPSIRFIVKSVSTGAVLANQAMSITSDSFNEFFVDFNAPVDGSDVMIILENNALTGTVGNDFAMDDITVKPYGPVIDAGLNTTTGPKSIMHCLNDGGKVYILKAFAHSLATPQYQWQFNFNKQGWLDMPGKTSATLTLAAEFQNPPRGKYEFRVGVLSAPGVSKNCQTFSEPISITVERNPVYDMPPITGFCEGDVLSINAEGGSDYYWTLPDGSHSTAHRLDVALSADKSYEGTYVVTISKDGCSITTQTEVRVYPPFNPIIMDTQPVICQGESVQIGVNEGTTFKWTPSTGLDHDDVAKPIASPSVTTEYTLAVSNGGCVRERSVKVTVLDRPVANAGPDLGMEEDKPIKLQGSAKGSQITYFWTPSDDMKDPTSLTPTINPHDDVVYTLHVQSPLCGEVQDQVKVKVFKKLVIPNSFSPNADGVNDIWRIEKLNTYPESVLTVYTRSGEEVFRTVGDARQWNGNYGNKQLPPGTYYYLIDRKNNLSKLSGWVLLIR
ncbi:gliding motility-associated C-terminal domain-containing protein [Mucilaginibacter conchicola]|uniref:Gliding motility-associated C-terminal domain-containing protein n=1 Tax=Mucilaginibacter conchicola TaxID=2303333 RepID=A0A372NTQ5_9SPHI|nr:gliding motility-associated C-terminal domain-containing protein [Mucilaginibacter conchicola]RFZ92059.1 gliding motility-associated C-terminal domain-containing protein [Mucilaginibacter conchicola]